MACVRCGYDLHGLPVDVAGSCPECGCSRALTSWFYSKQTTAWRRTTVRGLYLIIIPFALSVVISILYLPLTYLSISSTAYSPPEWMSVAVWALWYIGTGLSRVLTPIGVFLATRQPPLQTDETPAMRGCRHWSRWVVVVCGIAILTLPVVVWIVDIAAYEFDVGYGSVPLLSPELSLIAEVLRNVLPWVSSAGFTLFIVFLMLLAQATEPQRLFARLRLLLIAELVYYITSLAATLWMYSLMQGNNGAITNASVSTMQRMQTIGLMFQIVHVGLLLWTGVVFWSLARWLGQGLRKSGKMTS
ncbi:MAG: hypothetical protein HND57_13700 [Planctomycetes bacterium]|nr:hypothetical protein [Planctomycetota bacterium]